MGTHHHILRWLSLTLLWMSLSLSAAVQAAPDPTLVGYWTFDEGTGNTAADSSGNGNTATLNNNPAWVSGKLGSAVNFDGSTQSATIGNIVGLASGNTPHTIAAWVKVNVLPVTRAWILLLGSPGTGAHHWLLNPDGSTQLGSWNGNQVKPILPVGQWKHIAITFDGTTLTGYIDGSPIGSIGSGFNLTGLPLTLAQPQFGENYFNGQIDDLHIYNRALSASEVATLASPTTSPVNTPPTVNLTAPTNNQSYSAPANITITANAADSDGTVSKVDFYNGATLIGTSTAAPYSFTWSNVPQGSYSLTAKATDNGGATTTSTPVNVTVTAASGGGADPTLIGYWTFDEGAGTTAADSSGNGNTATLVNNPAWVSGKVGGGLSFSGGSDYAQVNNSALLQLGQNNTDFSVAFYMNLRQGATGQWRSVMHKGNTDNDRTFAFWMTDNDNRLHFTASMSNGSYAYGFSSSGIPLNTWVHIGYTKSGNVLSLYINGVLDTQVTAAAPIIGNTGPLYIGKDPWYQGTNSILDDLHIYNRALSASEVATLASPSTPPTTVNVALNANGGIASASSTFNSAYPIEAINDGDRAGAAWGSGGGWNDATNASYPDWAQITFNGIKTINEIDVITTQSGTSGEPTLSTAFNQYGISDFDVQYWNGTSWVRIPNGSVANNTNVWRQFKFSPINTDRIRVMVYKSLNLGSPYDYSRIIELEAWSASSTATNTPPTVNLTAPTNNQSYTAPANITISANAADSDGTVKKVDFYNGATLIGTTTTAPYSFTWNNVSQGSYSLTAKATDNGGATATSTPVNITVSAAPSPVPPPSTGAAGPFTYTYDEIGRVIAMTDGAGNAVQYDYDAVGNIIAIKPSVSSTVSIIDFAPNAGTAGTTVTISGTGFSTTPSSNSVNFNGLAATVTSATATQLVVTAPDGVTAGPIRVTSPQGSAVSSRNFSVGSSLSAPTITGFTPTVGATGTTVTVTGANFDGGAGRTKVRFGQTPTFNVNVASSTSLTATVPSNAASGKIRVATPVGYVESAADFIIPPTGTAAGDIVDIQRILVGGTQTLNITPPNKVGLLLFDGSSNTYLTLNITALSTSPAASAVTYQIYAPNGALIASGTISDAARSINVPRITQAGTYSIYFKPGAATATVSAALNTDPAIAADGAAVTVSLAGGQNGRLTFTGSAGQNLGLGITGLMLSPVASMYAYVDVSTPDGSLVNSATCYTSQPCQTSLSNLPVNGTYSIVVIPRASGTGSFTATLSSDVTGVLTVGTPLNLSLSRAGQNGRLTFSGTVGDSIGLYIARLTTTPASQTVAVTVFKPDGTTLSYTTASGAGGFLNLTNLPVTGTYTVFIAPSNAATASMQVTLDPGTALVLDGAPTNVTLATAGQTAQLTFSGSVGQNLGLGITGLTLSSAASTSASVYVYKPDGRSLTSTVCYPSQPGCQMSLSNLPVNGTYSIVVIPEASGTGSFTATLSSDVTGVLTVGTPLNLSLSRAGQNGRLTFTGSAGQTLGLAVSGLATTPAGGNLGVYIDKPDGTVFSTCSGGMAEPGTSCDIPALPVAGTYTIRLKPSSTNAANFSVTLSSDISGVLTANGPAQTFATSRMGQNGRYTFSGTMGQNLSLLWSGSTFSGYWTYVTVYKPDGTYMSTGYMNDLASGYGSGKLNLVNLPATGTYTVFIDPYGLSTGQVDISLKEDATGAIAIDGAAVTVALAGGQNGRLTFSGSAGQNLGVGITGLTLSSATSSSGSVYVYQPDGRSLTGTVCYPSQPGCQMSLSNLPVNGTYSIVVIPEASGTGSFTATLSSDVTGVLTVGTPLNLSLSRAGQNGRLTFSGNVGDSIGLDIAGLTTTPASQTVAVTVYKPDGTTLSSGSASTAGGFLNLTNLPMTGTYTVFIEPYYAATASMQVMLDPGTALVLDGAPSAVTIGTAGQTARLTFTGSAGQNLGVGITGLTLSPAASTYAYVYVYKPDGSSLTSMVCYMSQPGCQMSLSNLPVNGTYSVVVTPAASGTGSFTATLSSDVTGVLTAGTPLNLSLSRAGQNGRLTFSGTVGDSIGIGIAGLTTTPASQAVTMTVYKPDGTTLSSASTSAAGGFLNLANLPVTGIYTVVIDPSYAATANMQVTLDPGTALTLDGAPSAVTIGTAGQTARLTFSGSVGQNLGVGITGLTLSPAASTSASVYVYKPDGNYLTSTTCYTSQPGCQLNLSNLPVNGTYSIVVIPGASGTGSFTATLSSDVTGVLTAGTPLNLSLSRAGQNGRLTFSGTVGTRPTLTFSGINTNPSGQSVTFTVYQPNGNYVTSTSSGTSATLTLTSLPATGTYTLLVDPSYGATATLSVTLSP